MLRVTQILPYDPRATAHEVVASLISDGLLAQQPSSGEASPSWSSGTNDPIKRAQALFTQINQNGTKIEMNGAAHSYVKLMSQTENYMKQGMDPQEAISTTTAELMKKSAPIANSGTFATNRQPDWVSGTATQYPHPTRISTPVNAVTQKDIATLAASHMNMTPLASQIGQNPTNRFSGGKQGLNHTA